MFQWRRFQFFDKHEVKEEGTSSALNISPSFDLNCIASGLGHVIIPDTNGTLNLIKRDFTFTSFPGFDSQCLLLHQLQTQHILIGVGYDQAPDATITTWVKLWHLERLNATQQPLLIRQFKLFPSTKFSESKPTCLTALEDMTQIVIGCTNGMIIVFHGDMMRDRLNNKVKLLSPPSDAPVTGLVFHATLPVLFAVTTHTIHAWRPLSKSDAPVLLADSGVSLPNCTALSPHTSELTVACPEAVYFYNTEERGPCFAFDGHKWLMHWFRHYLIVVSSPVTASHTAPSSHTLYIYDLKNKFIAFMATFPPIRALCCEWGKIIVFSNNYRVYTLGEKDTQTKLDVLFKKNLYSIAINLATRQSFDMNIVMEIFRKYGDHLYSKGDYDGAVEQYAKTIGTLEPSYVIRKFLDAQRTRNLTCYLQKLHEQRLATQDHTTLLLNCYTKLKDVERLNSFIRDPQLCFDSVTAISVCRQSGYFHHALWLAFIHKSHASYVKIQIEDLGAYDPALDYIASLDFESTIDMMQLYGKTLISHFPNKTTALLMELCTNYSPDRPSFHHTCDESLGDMPMELPEQIPNHVPTPSKSAIQMLTSVMQAISFTKDQLLSSATPSETPDVMNTSILCDFANADDFIHIYVDHPQWLIVFLEYLIATKPLDVSPLVYNTLLELYLRNDVAIGEHEVDPSQSHTWESIKSQRVEKAMAILMDPTATYDADFALVLTRIHACPEGTLFLYEKLNLYDEMLNHYIESNQIERILEIADQYGNESPHLWISALNYFAQSPEHHGNQVSRCLSEIESRSLLSPMRVIEILGKNPQIPLSVVKSFILKQLCAENQQLNDDALRITQYQQETEKMKAEIHAVENEAQLFQNQKCADCTGPLELPTIHFLCHHSYHQRCLGDEKECPACLPQHQKVLDARQEIESQNASQSFMKELKAAQDPFQTIAEYFGRGIFS